MIRLRESLAERVEFLFRLFFALNFVAFSQQKDLFRYYIDFFTIILILDLRLLVAVAI